MQQKLSEQSFSVTVTVPQNFTILSRVVRQIVRAMKYLTNLENRDNQSKLLFLL